MYRWFEAEESEKRSVCQCEVCLVALTGDIQEQTLLSEDQIHVLPVGFRSYPLRVVWGVRLQA